MESSQKTLEQIQKELQGAVQKGVVVETHFWVTFQKSEDLLIQLMNTETPPPPLPPGADESIEFGWVLYYLNNKAPSWLKPILKFLKMPPSKITTKEWDHWWTIWEGEGKLTGDGSLVSTAKYAELDMGDPKGTGWPLAILNFLYYKLFPKKIHPFVHNDPPTTIKITPSSQPSLKIALFGDWGTGKYKDGNLPDSPSQMVMQQITKQNPDIMIHLGDVYYAGLESEEQNNLLNCWKPAPLGNFTLNSNHEMYDGANGLYKTALASPVFEKQKGATYFSITYGDWVIIGLDSAYNATDMYMDGVINDTYQSGPEGFIATQSKGKKIILLTHHNPMDVQGKYTNSLWNDVVKDSLMGRHPEVWYWGHIHNGVVYNNTAASRSTLARCLGHSGIPFGNAEWLEGNHNGNISTIDYYAHTPLENPSPNNKLRVKNGFAILEIKDGKLTEIWYDQDGTLSWTSKAPELSY